MKYWTIKQVAEELGLSERRTRIWAQRLGVGTFVHSRLRLLTEEEAQRLIDYVRQHGHPGRRKRLLQEAAQR